MTASGLTDAEVAQRVAQGKGNDIPERATRGVVDIIRANVFTRINAILGVLLIIVLATGSVINGMFFLDTSNLAVTSVALGIGVLGAAVIEAMWWIRARMLGVEPQVWRRPAAGTPTTTTRVLPAK